jgi:DNA mismatch repair protein MSH5
VINTTITPLGKKLFHTWLLRPLTNIDRINARLDAVQLLSSHEYTGPRQNIKRDMKNIKNIGGFCLKIKSGRASWKDWLGLVEVSSGG